MPEHNIKIGISYMDDDSIYKSYYGVTLDQCEKYNVDSNISNKELELYITTFDGLLYIKYQIKILRNFLKDIDFNVVFCDTNSHINPESSQKTKELCIRENVGYVKMPHNIFQDIPCFSTKLGTDMNWIWRNCIKLRKPKYFGFIDQDCYLIDHIWEYLKNYLDEKGMYGYVWPAEKDFLIDKKYWLIHVISNFFSYEFVKDFDFDFRPAGFIGLDVSGCNYFSIFQHFNREDYLQTQTHISDFIGPEWEDIFRKFEMQDNEKWIHIMNSTKAFTGHLKEKEYKELYMAGLLDGILFADKIASRV